MILKIQAKWPFISTKKDPTGILGQFVEYFDAIAKGEYEKNGRAPRIRTFEKIMIDEANRVIKNYEN